MKTATADAFSGALSAKPGSPAWRRGGVGFVARGIPDGAEFDLVTSEFNLTIDGLGVVRDTVTVIPSDLANLHDLVISSANVLTGAFTVGDQLLWGAAEPLRRILSILRSRN